MSKSMSWSPVAAGRRRPGSYPRHVAAWMLRRAGAALSRLSRRLAAVDAGHRPRHEPVIEFHAEAGAPEGALYVDGRLIGQLHGVTRL